MEFESHDGRVGRLSYDHVIIACGRVVNIGMVPGMADHALPLKTVGPAIAQPDPLRRGCGVETAGEIKDLLRSSRRFFCNFSTDDTSVKIIHSRNQLLLELSPTLREFARLKLEQAGIEVILNARVTTATPQGVRLGDGRTIRFCASAIGILRIAQATEWNKEIC